MIRLIASDLDDTLLNAQSDLTERTLRALKSAMDAGILVSLSSGRMSEAMEPFAKRIDVNAPMIEYNGALIVDPADGRTLFSTAIQAETALAVARALEEMDIYFQVYPGRGYFCAHRTPHTAAYEASIRVPCQEVGVSLSRWMQGSMIKMLAIASPEKIDAAQARLRAAFPEGVSFMKSKPHYLEIISQGVDKGAALRALCAELGVAKDEVMAFGDGQNDAPLLAAAGWGVAVENAAPDCKAAARLIAPANTEDGVAQVIEQLLRGDLREARRAD